MEKSKRRKLSRRANNDEEGRRRDQNRINGSERENGRREECEVTDLEGWNVTKTATMAASKLCDSCKSATATLFCRNDAAYLCIPCESKIHAANKVASRHARVWMCEVCEQAPAHVTCKADAAALCVTCDRDIHSANPLARRHERFPVVPFYDSVASAGVHSYLTEADEAEAKSWLMPNLNSKIDDSRRR